MPRPLSTNAASSMPPPLAPPSRGASSSSSLQAILPIKAISNRLPREGALHPVRQPLVLDTRTGGSPTRGVGESLLTIRRVDRASSHTLPEASARGAVHADRPVPVLLAEQLPKDVALWSLLTPAEQQQSVAVMRQLNTAWTGFKEAVVAAALPEHLLYFPGVPRELVVRCLEEAARLPLQSLLDYPPFQSSFSLKGAAEGLKAPALAALNVNIVLLARIRQRHGIAEPNIAAWSARERESIAAVDALLSGPFVNVRSVPLALALFTGLQQGARSADFSRQPTASSSVGKP